MAEVEKAKRTIATHCDSRCQYADPEAAADCSCECAGANHGKGEDQRVWQAKEDRLGITRKAFRKFLNGQEPKTGTRLYRRNREEFDKQYAIWKTEQEAKQAETDEQAKA